MRRLFLADWNVAVRSHELGWYIVKCHHEPSTWRDLDRAADHDEVGEVREALWLHHHKVRAPRRVKFFFAVPSPCRLLPPSPPPP